MKPYPDREACVLRLTTVEATKSARFVAVLIPSHERNRTERDGWKSRVLNGDGWTVVEVRRKTLIDQILFKTGAGRASLFGKYRTDADQAAVTTTDEGEFVRLWARDFTVVGTEQTPLLKSSARITASLECRGLETLLERV